MKVLDYIIDNFDAIEQRAYEELYETGEGCFNETALVMGIISLRNDLSEADREKINLIGDFIEYILASPQVMEGVETNPTRVVPMIGLAGVHLKRIGRTFPDMKSVVSNYLGVDFTEGETNEVGIRWFQSQFGKELSVGDIIDQSISKYTSLSLLTREQAYQFTHEIFWATDFGVADFPVSSKQDIMDYIDNLFENCITNNDYDLVGELLICSKICGWSSTAQNAYNWFMSKWETDNCFQNVEGTQYDKFVGQYHTIFVGGILEGLM